MGIDSTKTSDERKLSRQRIRDKYPTQFASDEYLASSIVWKLAYLAFWVFPNWFHDIDILGEENLPEGGAVLVGLHSTHNVDIITSQFILYQLGGRFPRGLIHRVLFNFISYVRWLGLVPGYRDSGVALLESGFYVGIMPGGAEEAMTGHENAYRLHDKWDERRGYVRIAKEANVPIVPIFIKNVEEMRFNLIFFILNLIGFTRFWNSLMINSSKRVSWLLKQISMFTWYIFSWIAFPVPVKICYVIGNPIIPDYEKESVDDIADRTKTEFQELINKNQPYGHQYLPGLKQRWKAFYQKEKARRGKFKTE